MHITSMFIALLLAGPAAAQITCFPPPIDTCGKGVVRGTAAGDVEWAAWWVEQDFDWRRVQWYRLPGTPMITPPLPPGVLTAKDYAATLWRANMGAAMRSCTSPHKEAVAACNAMVLASEATRPPPILYDVDKATSADGTRPGYKRTATNQLAADGTRHRAGAWCECWRGALKPSVTGSQYCLVTNTASYSVCRRLP